MSIPCVCIDPGHGMGNRTEGRFDSGAVANGMRESDIVLDWSLALKAAFVEAGIPYFLIRDDSTDPTPVGRRADQATLAGCGLLLSIHCNSGPDSATGVETFYRDSDDLAWARRVQIACVKATGLKSRGCKSESDSQHGRLAVLKFKGPAALLETGFLSNITDRSIIASRETRIRFARSLVAGLREIYGTSPHIK